MADHHDVRHDDQVIARRTDLDFVRFLALISMYVAHVAPTPGPRRVLALSEYLTMPLFALVVGVGAQLAHWQTVAVGDRRPRWFSLAIRASALVGLGLVLERAGTQVVIVLVHLGALVVLGALLARCPSVAVATVGIAAFVLTPLLLRHAQIAGVPFGVGATSEDWVVRIELFLWRGCWVPSAA